MVSYGIYDPTVLKFRILFIKRIKKSPKLFFFYSIHGKNLKKILCWIGFNEDYLLLHYTILTKYYDYDFFQKQIFLYNLVSSKNKQCHCYQIKSYQLFTHDNKSKQMHLPAMRLKATYSYMHINVIWCGNVAWIWVRIIGITRNNLNGQ